MTSGRLLAAGAATVAVLTGASVLLLSRLDGAAPGAPPPATSQPPAPPATPVVAEVPAPPAPSPAPAPRPQAFQPSVRGLPSASDQAAWERVPVAIRLADLGPLAAAVHASLETARQDMSRCFEAEARAGGDGTSPGEEAPTGPGVLVLRLESRERGLDVAGTEVASRGTSSAALVACCREVLRGWSIPAEAAQPGKRYRLELLLQ